VADGPYNPLQRRHLAESIVRALLDEQPIVPLAAVPTFVGAGVYVIYYHGPFPAYAAVAEADTPIYVGKAVPEGSRVGDDLDVVPGQELAGRLLEHAESIRQAADFSAWLRAALGGSAPLQLSLDEFSCRYLVVEDIFIPLGESLLINKYAPLWNRRIKGFGNHTPGGNRFDQRRSQWDTIHPGRPWAFKCQQRANESRLFAEWGGGPSVPRIGHIAPLRRTVPAPEPATAPQVSQGGRRRSPQVYDGSIPDDLEIAGMVADPPHDPNPDTET